MGGHESDEPYALWVAVTQFDADACVSETFLRGQYRLVCSFAVVWMLFVMAQRAVIWRSALAQILTSGGAALLTSCTPRDMLDIDSYPVLAYLPVSSHPNFVRTQHCWESGKEGAGHLKGTAVQRALCCRC